MGLVLGPSNELLESFLHNPDDQGWHFSAGDPEFWEYSSKLLKPGGRLLDVGIGLGRSSLFFALHGMQVTGYDNNPEAVAKINAMARDVGQSIDFSVQAYVADVTDTDF